MFDFFITQVLGMRWLSDLVEFMLQKGFGLDIKTSIGGSVHFFTYDTIKIVILLVVSVFIITYIQSYFPPERTKRILKGFTGIKGNVIAALLGTITPFCSCSSIPIFIGFIRAGLPMGLTFSFLISSPLVDIASLLMLISFFGVNFSLAYVVLGVVLAVLGGSFLQRFSVEKNIKQYNDPVKELYAESELFGRKQRFEYAKQETFLIFKSVYRYIILGVAVGALIHNWVPQKFVLAVLGADNPFGVIIATLIGIPIYADIFGTLPIAEALFLAGVPAGTILAFMMAVTALSAPSIILLSNVLRPKFLAIFVAIVAIGIIIIGYAINASMGIIF